MLGGAMGIAIVNSVLNNYVRTHLEALLSDQQLDGILGSASGIAQYAPAVQETIRRTYGEAYNWQMRVTTAFSAAHFLAVALMWKKQPMRLGKDGIPE